MHQKISFFTRQEEGQALVETPIIIGILTCMVFMLIQPCLTLITRVMVGYATASLARVEATSSTATVQNAESVYRQYIQHKLNALPKSDYFYLPSSLDVVTGAGSDASKREIEISVKQQPLPIVGALLAEDDGCIHIKEKTSVLDSLAFSQPENTQQDLIVGAQ